MTTLTLTQQPQTFTLPIPADIVGKSAGRLELLLHYPDAVSMAPGIANTYKRSIKLLTATLAPAAS